MIHPDPLEVFYKVKYIQALMTLEKCSKMAKIFYQNFDQNYQIPLKHLVKVFNALRNYLVESIGYDNDAHYNALSSPKHKVLSRPISAPKTLFESKFLCMHRHYFFHQQMFQNRLTASLPLSEVLTNSLPIFLKI